MFNILPAATMNSQAADVKELFANSSPNQW
jgi:hypothetical protein